MAREACRLSTLDALDARLAQWQYCCRQGRGHQAGACPHQVLVVDGEARPHQHRGDEKTSLQFPFGELYEPQKAREISSEKMCLAGKHALLF